KINFPNATIISPLTGFHTLFAFTKCEIKKNKNYFFIVPRVSHGVIHSLTRFTGKSLFNFTKGEIKKNKKINFPNATIISPLTGLNTLFDFNTIEIKKALQ
ncbi:MAG: hypothetical protein L0Y76_05700, partial [Ignavibacteria bacterium]|nr:hypothetical protein [Ignavibacteria bacterium]